MGARVIYSHRFRFTLESTLPRQAGNPEYKFQAETGRTATLTIDGKPVAVGAPSGLISFETQESLEAQTGGMVFGWSEMAKRLEPVIRTNDHMRIEISLDDDVYYLAHDGFISKSAVSGSSTTAGVTWSFSVLAEGIQKLLRQAVWNWQGAMCLGENAILMKKPMAEYKTLAEKALTFAPHEIIKSIVSMFLNDEVGMPLKISGKSLSEFMDFSVDWTSLYKDSWPNMATLIANTWSGSFWDWIKSMSDPALHELYWVYYSDGDTHLNRLAHRPRPFPGIDSEAWDNLFCWKLGVDDLPGAIGYNVQRSDAQRANVFHWGSGGFTDGGGELYSKMELGLWVDTVGRERYGFAPRMVSTNLIPKAGDNFVKMVRRILEHVARQDAPLHELQEVSLQYPVPLPSIRPGEAVEDASMSITGYISSVAHRGQWTTSGLQAGTTLGVSRALRGVTFEKYAAKVKTLTSLHPADYKKESKDELPEHEKGLESKKTGVDPAPSKASQSSAPNQAAINSAAKRHGVPAWLIASTMRKESSSGTDPRMLKPNSAGALGIAQLRPIAVKDLADHGYKKADGTPFTEADRLNDAASIDAAAAYQKMCCIPTLEKAGLSKSNPDYWAYVASAYNSGPTGASKQGAANGWGPDGVTGYGQSVAKGQGSFPGSGK